MFGHQASGECDAHAPKVCTQHDRCASWRREIPLGVVKCRPVRVGCSGRRGQLSSGDRGAVRRVLIFSMRMLIFYLYLPNEQNPLDTQGGEAAAEARSSAPGRNP
ncbi:protein of unknown function [Burkholderia multivorans]